MHWACEICIVRPMCRVQCFKTKLPHSFCDHLCNIDEQSDCKIFEGKSYYSLHQCEKLSFYISQYSLLKRWAELKLKNEKERSIFFKG